MKFPLINELVTTNVTQVKIDDTLNDAIHLMHQENHRNVIVNDKNRFFIVTASDLLKLKLKGHDFSKPLPHQLTDTIQADLQAQCISLANLCSKGI
jgi:CBS domain-containing protein